MPQGTINITLDRNLWDDLSRVPHQQSIRHERRFSTIEALRVAVRVFLRLHAGQINEILTRDTRTIG